MLSLNSSPVQDEMTVNMALHRGVKSSKERRQLEQINPTRVTTRQPQRGTSNATDSLPRVYEGTSSEDQDATVVVSGGTKSFEN